MQSFLVRRPYTADVSIIMGVIVYEPSQGLPDSDPHSLRNFGPRVVASAYELPRIPG